MCVRAWPHYTHVEVWVLHEPALCAPRSRGEDRVAVAYFGDGAASEGDALTALNFAALFKSQVPYSPWQVLPIASNNE